MKLLCLDLLPVNTQPATDPVVDDDSSIMYSTDDILAALSELTAPQAELEDLSLREEDDWIEPSSSLAHLVMRVISPAVARDLLTGDPGSERLRSQQSFEHISNRDDGGGGGGNDEFLKSGSSLDFGERVTDYPAGATNLQNTFTSSSEVGHSVSDHIVDEKDVGDYSVDGDTEDYDSSQNGSVGRGSFSVGVKPADQTLDELDLVSSAVSEVDRDSRRFGFWPECNGRNDDDHSTVKSLLGSEDASTSRFVTSLFVLLTDELGCLQTSSCYTDDRSIEVDVSSHML